MKTNIANTKISPSGMVQVSHIARENASKSILIESEVFRKYSFAKFI